MNELEVGEDAPSIEFCVFEPVILYILEVNGDVPPAHVLVKVTVWPLSNLVPLAAMVGKPNAAATMTFMLCEQPNDAVVAPSMTL